jgi:hypothetical protein
MSDKTATSLFMLSPLESRYAGFYQQLFSGIVSYRQLGNRLIQLAERANAFRQLGKVRQLAELLIGLPIIEYQHVGQYYLALAIHRNGKGDIERAQRILESVISKIHLSYKAKAILLLAAVSARKRDYDSEFYYFTESLRAEGTIDSIITARRGIAVSKARAGYNQQALKDLESLTPLIQYTKPNTYYDFLNSYAVELGESGRVYEARNISRIVLASPFAFAYPEWQDTANDLREPNRSFVTVPLIECEQVEITEIVSQLASQITKPAEVIPFKLKEAPEPTMPEPMTPQESRQLSLIDKRDLIIAAIRASEMSEFEYDKLMVSVGLLKGGPADEILDLEDQETLDDMVVVWADNIGAETLAGVFSALRDCDDSLRRNDIIDRIIKKAFQQTHLSGLTEEAWRLRVERRLPEK